ncbi:MAG: phosphoribosylamine--glycine ligase [Deltaproteobacteria bacterium]|nr:phosphoribosylamine--glycine ligase [Candidatus Anaeroferrophillus wilburensis]MBN2888459.1 phosphoribosylamine--glycine ligase [Deltaproteobacteria bacterium]
MKILVVGGGGREHALIWKIAQSNKVSRIFCAPGNAGIAQLATCLPIKANDIDGLLKFALEEEISLTVVGPEKPLTEGIVDRFSEHNLKIFGPSKLAAEIEGSKTFCKNLLQQYNIPSGYFASFDNIDDAIEYIYSKGAPIVVKADGLAAGKGVVVAQTVEEAEDAVHMIMRKKAFGEAGNRVVIEEFLEGEEASFLVFTDGDIVIPMVTSQDHKPIFDGDRGPNTGGMGAYSPAPVITDGLFRRIMNDIMIPTVKGMAAEGRKYRGVLYAGLMIKEGIPRVLEFNARFGDPEAQPLLMRLKSDLVPILEACITGHLAKTMVAWDERPAVCVVMASEGYPGSYEKGRVITGLSTAEDLDDVMVFHAGTTMNEEGQVVNNGGRVLGVTALGPTIPKAINLCYRTVEKISWPGAQYRKDIGQKALKRLR